MPGVKIKLPMKFNNPGLPVLRDDAVLPAAGAMMLIDPTHDLAPWDAGVPADGTYLPNLAESQALAMFGAGSTDVRPKLKYPAAFTGSAGKLERTGKGGLHGIVSQAGAAPAQSGPVLAFSNALVKYVLDNPTHDFYVSLWARLTRRPSLDYDNSAIFAFNGNGQQTNSYLFHLAPDGAINTNYLKRPTAPIGLRETPSGSDLGNKFFSMATDSWKTATAGMEGSLPGDGTNNSVTGPQAGAGLPFGPAAWNGIGKTGATTELGVFTPPGSSTPGTNKDKCASHIIYRFYMEDLTVSGRDHATVDALSYAQYTKHVLTPGGRYHGDTFTDPATIA